MRQLIGLIGIAMCGLSAGMYYQGPRLGICLGLFIIGAGLTVDSLKK